MTKFHHSRLSHNLSAIITVFLTLLFAVSCASFPHNGVDRIRSISLYPENLPASLDGYKIAFVSDVHYGNNFSRARLDALFAGINAEKPDCIILGGDFTLGKKEMADFADAVRNLKASEGVYAVLGNHDFFNGRKEIITDLRNAGVVVLDETLINTPKGITIAGINDFRDIYPDLVHLREILEPSPFTILACHDPDFAEETNLSAFDIVLSGHTHGGQITLFGFAPVLPSAYGQKYRTGTVEKDGSKVIISNGAGYGGNILRFRLFAPSDFLLISLRANSPKKDR